MRISTIRIENFRCFRDETIQLSPYSCLVGPNGCGKSTVLTALNVFFQERATSVTDVSKLIDEDFHRKNTQDPVKITLTFAGLSQDALSELANYVRNGELVVTAEAAFDEKLGHGTVRHYGQRLGMKDFRPFFDATKSGTKADDLNKLYDELRPQFADLPAARSKEAKAEALRNYESQHQDRCVLIPSADDFYGINSTGKLAKFVQWVYVPAVKDVHEEGQEGKNTALGKLIARAVRTRTNFDEELAALRADTMVKYQELLDKNQTALSDVSQSLEKRLESWAHPDARLDMQWIYDRDKSVSLQQPVAGIRTGDGDFLGSLARMGHGLQRSYLLALLQELAGSDDEDAPTLILGCEEPELYQHPPQARHMADVFIDLSHGNNQIIVTTHSPLFVSGKGFEDVRLVIKQDQAVGTKVKSLTFDRLCARVREARGEDASKRMEGLVAKIHQALLPGIAEMFFARVPILVEGLEDASYITTELHLYDKWPEFRRLGCYLIPANGKDKLIQPLAIARELSMQVFVVFDSDGDTTRPDHRTKHELDNSALMRLLGTDYDPFPDQSIIGTNHAIWATNLGDIVKADFGDSYQELANIARANYANEGGLEKHDLFIAEWLTMGRTKGLSSNTLQRLCDAILTFASSI